MECVRINLLHGTGWTLFSSFSDQNPELNKNNFAKEFEQQYRCKVYKDVDLDTYYMEFTLEQWTWFRLKYDFNDFEFL